MPKALGARGAQCITSIIPIYFNLAAAGVGAETTEWWWRRTHPLFVKRVVAVARIKFILIANAV